MLLFSGCQEKIPLLPYDQPLAAIDTLLVPADYIQIRNLVVPGKLGSHAYLYVGENEWVKAYSLLRFADLGSLPDTLDSLVSCTLFLFSSTALLSDSSHDAYPTIQLSWLKSNTAAEWAEDSVSTANFDPGQFQLDQLTSFQFAYTDTFALDLTSRAVELITAWRDTNQTNHGLLLSLGSAAPTGIGTFFSRNSSYVPYLSIITVENGDTVTRKITCSGDAPLLYFNQNQLDLTNRLVLSSGLSSYLFVKVNLDQFHIDPNWVVGDAVLKFTLDPALSVDYAKTATIYLSLLDSTDWDTTSFGASSNYQVAHSQAAASSVIKLDLPRSIQNITSGYSKNFGFVVWIATGSYSPILYSLYPTAADSSHQPYLKLFLLKER